VFEQSECGGNWPAAFWAPSYALTRLYWTHHRWTSVVEAPFVARIPWDDAKGRVRMHSLVRKQAQHFGLGKPRLSPAKHSLGVGPNCVPDSLCRLLDRIRAGVAPVLACSFQRVPFALEAPNRPAVELAYGQERGTLATETRAAGVIRYPQHWLRLRDTAPRSRFRSLKYLCGVIPTLTLREGRDWLGFDHLGACRGSSVFETSLGSAVSQNKSGIDCIQHRFHGLFV